LNKTDGIIESLDFTSDKIFKYVLTLDISDCKEFINRIEPSINTEGNWTADPQHEVIVGPDKKSIWLDTLARNELNYIDFEMFRYKPKDFLKTARYHVSMIDSSLATGRRPADLPNVTVIFLCTYDPFDRGDPIYRIHSTMEEYPVYDYPEGRKIIFVTNQGIEKAPDPLKPIVYLLTRNPEPIDDPFYWRMIERVNQVKQDPLRRIKIMDEIERDEHIREEGREEGIEVGKEKERNGAIANFILKFRLRKWTDREIFRMLMDLYPGYEEMIRKIINNAEAYAAIR